MVQRPSHETQKKDGTRASLAEQIKKPILTYKETTEVQMNERRDVAEVPVARQSRRGPSPGLPPA